MRPLGAGVTLPQAALRLLGVLWSGAAPRLFADEAADYEVIVAEAALT